MLCSPVGFAQATGIRMHTASICQRVDFHKISAYLNSNRAAKALILLAARQMPELCGKFIGETIRIKLPLLDLNRPEQARLLPVHPLCIFAQKLLLFVRKKVLQLAFALAQIRNFPLALLNRDGKGRRLLAADHLVVLQLGFLLFGLGSGKLRIGQLHSLISAQLDASLRACGRPE